MNELKKCSKCGQELPATNEYFYRNKTAKDGLQTYCKECVKTNNKKKKSNIVDFSTNKEELISDSISAEVFQNSEFGNLRTLEINGEPWFVGKDVAECLGYKNLSRDINRHVDEEDKITKMIPQYQNGTLVSKTLLINESGLYSLIMSSKLPSAKRFKQWVTSEVLPSIRKHGTYMTPDMLEKVLLNPDTIIKIAQQLKDEQEKNKLLQNKIEADAPDVLFSKIFSKTEENSSVGDFAKVLCDNGFEIGEQRLFKWLRDNKYLMVGNMPYQRYMTMRVFKVKRGVHNRRGYPEQYTQTLITPSGQKYLFKKMLEDPNLGLSA